MARFQTKPISGARDFLPVDVLRRQYVIGVIERVYQSYGFEPLDTPVMERLDTLLGKYGEEGDQLIFRVAKRGAKLQRALADAPTEDDIADAGLRYDLTVPLARIVAEYSNQLPRYFKRYHIAPVYRADRPAKGRFREFYQCDLDVVGSSSQLVEAEVLNAGAQVLQELGFRGRDESGFRLRLNHRGVLRGLMEVSGVPAELETVALVAVDKLDKIGLDGVEKELRARGIGQTATAALLELMAAAPDETDAILAWLNDRLAGSANGAQALAELEEVVTLTQTGPAGAHIRIDPYLARGPELLYRTDLRDRVSHFERLRRRGRTLRRSDRHVQQPLDPRLRLQPGTGADSADYGRARPLSAKAGRTAPGVDHEFRQGGPGRQRRGWRTLCAARACASISTRTLTIWDGSSDMRRTQHPRCPSVRGE